MRFPFFFGIAVSGVIQTGSVFYLPRGSVKQKKAISRKFFSARKPAGSGPFARTGGAAESKICNRVEEKNDENMDGPLRPGAAGFRAATRQRRGEADVQTPRSAERSPDAVPGGKRPKRLSGHRFTASDADSMTSALGNARIRRNGFGPFFFLLSVLAGAGCGERSDLQVARRILENHRRFAGVKPLPGAQVMSLKLSAPRTGERAEGTGRIEWDGLTYRETVTSAGSTTVRGIQAGKAYLTDEDGVTRVTSEPTLSELLTRSYFWRRAYLFDDLEKARIALGPADAATVSVQLIPRGGHPLLLIFSNRGELVRARSPRFQLEFAGPRRLTDASRPGAPVEVEISSITLPSDQMVDTQVGGWTARWPGPSSEAVLLRIGRGPGMDARLGGVPIRISLDAGADGPLRVRAGLAQRLGLSPQPDVFGRRLAKTGPLEIGALALPALRVQVSEEIPEGADAEAGGVLFRETVVEIDPAQMRIRFHDPAHWTAPAGYFRALLDDDGNRPVAVIRQGSGTLRLRAGTGAPGLLVAPDSAHRMGLSAPGSVARELRWGTAPFPPVPVAVLPAAFDSDWGDDGSLGFDILLGFHVFWDMPHRWAYLRPLDAVAGVR